MNAPCLSDVYINEEDKIERRGATHKHPKIPYQSPDLLPFKFKKKKPNTIKKKLSVDLHRKVNHQLPDTDRFVISSRDLDLIIIALGRVLSNHLLLRGVATRFTPPLRRRGYYPPDRIGATPVGIISTIQCITTDGDVVPTDNGRYSHGTVTLSVFC